MLQSDADVITLIQDIKPPSWFRLRRRIGLFSDNPALLTARTKFSHQIPLQKGDEINISYNIKLSESSDIVEVLNYCDSCGRELVSDKNVKTFND